VQDGVSFWQRAYVATELPGGNWSGPEYRTLDRELSPFLAGTFGGTLRLQPNDIFSLNIVAEATYTLFLDDLYVYDRWGFLSATTMELTFE
jgi:hypothetical protein